MFSFSRANERIRDFFSDLRDVLQLRHLRHRRQQSRLQHAGTSEVQTLHPVPPCLHGHRICPRYWNLKAYKIHPLMVVALLNICDYGFAVVMSIVLALMRHTSCLNKFYYPTDDRNMKAKLFIQKCTAITN